MRGMSTSRVCASCGEKTPPYANYCNWDCQIAQARQLGGREILPNGLPIRCITASGDMLECEDGDHPDYLFPVEVWRDHFTDRDNEKHHESHALIYVDDAIALTLYEASYTLWSRQTGRFLSGPSFEVKNRLSAESLAKIARFANSKRERGTKP